MHCCPTAACSKLPDLRLAQFGIRVPTVQCRQGRTVAIGRGRSGFIHQPLCDLIRSCRTWPGIRVRFGQRSAGGARRRDVRSQSKRCSNDSGSGPQRPSRSDRTTHYSASERRISLAELRRRWVADLKKTLDMLVEVAPSAIAVVVTGFTAPDARFSSIAKQFVEEAGYSRYLP